MSKPSDLYPKKRVTTRAFVGVYLNKDPELITYADIEIVKNYLNKCINIENLSPKQIADKHHFVVADFGWIIKTHFDIKLKDHKTAQKNTAIQKGIVLTDAKYLYYKECEFNLSKQEITQIPGFDLLIKRGVYHPIKNPNGMVRDHILSRSEAYQKGYDPAHIRHPANCQFITNYENIKKNSHSGITYEQLLERISLWEQNLVPELSKERRVVEKTAEHIENIRKGVIARLDKIRSGEISSNMGKAGGRPATFHKKFEWHIINQDIKNGLTYSEISKLRNISYAQLRKAQRLGLIHRQR